MKKNLFESHLFIKISEKSSEFIDNFCGGILLLFLMPIFLSMFISFLPGVFVHQLILDKFNIASKSEVVKILSDCLLVALSICSLALCALMYPFIISSGDNGFCGSDFRC